MPRLQGCVGAGFFSFAGYSRLLPLTLNASEPTLSCEQLNLAPGPACDHARQLLADRIAAEAGDRQASSRRVSAQLSPLGAGAEAAGLIASLPGALAIALIAGGHVGGEWSGRTLKQLLTQTRSPVAGHRRHAGQRVGRRWRLPSVLGWPSPATSGAARWAERSELARDIHDVSPINCQRSPSKQAPPASPPSTALTRPNDATTTDIARLTPREPTCSTWS